MSYNDLTSANAFFATRRYSDSWNQASADERQKSLNEAFDAIERLNFIGTKTVDTQANSWPRKNIRFSHISLDSTIVPDDIKKAECLIAFEFLNGFDIEKEIKSSRVTSRGFSSVRTTYDPTLGLDFIEAGIPSAQAWAYLKPYLADASSLKLSRVS